MNYNTTKIQKLNFLKNLMVLQNKILIVIFKLY